MREEYYFDTSKNNYPEEVLLNMNTLKCTGCRSCELACSYHHTKKFNPYFSSINIYRDSKDAHIKYAFLDTCDLCVNEKIPACVNACSPRALCMLK